MFDFISTAISYIKDYSGAISKGFDIASDVYGAYSQYQSYQTAKDNAKAQKAELYRQKQLSEAKARKEARVNKARLVASGIQSSTVDLGVVGINSSLDSSLSDLSARTDYNVGAVNTQLDAAKSTAILNGVGYVASAAAGTKEFTDILDTNTTAVASDDLFSAPSGSFENRG